MKNKLLRGAVYLAAGLTFSILLYIVAFVVIKGLPHIKPSLFAFHYTTKNVSLMPAIISTLITVTLALAIATPIGVFTGFYLVEYAKRGAKWVEIIRIASDTLAGIPSIVYGLFGMLFFVIALKLQYSLLAGILTVSIMVLPLIVRSTEEALLSVNDSLRAASFGLGAGKLRTIFHIVLPVALPGILSGVILAMGRIVGETAALMYTLGTSTDLPKSLLSSGRTLALHMYVLSSEGFHVEEAYATGVVLMAIILVINGLSMTLAKQVGKKMR
ncbi:phosphate ABC transporter permease PstA [Atopobacter sp. AH10]|uniref:phosphate ABC transporter permease PstA n=1 Tax=Atopobacter sp. AH10 TaxID=2315861 RepID=UPI000EF26856|nr:phosphate ABC transporter permease PstA [Atopobacter sp. AH10]RLK63077.1 phosphate ABC transporter permease PstA [Atopobacter sp. AH10]